MFVNSAAPSPPGFIDRIRGLIAKLFGSPGRAPQGPEVAPTEKAGGARAVRAGGGSDRAT
jgi:hypothetical protein